MSSPLSHIISQLPEHGETIRILYLVDEDFRTLCEDYYTSKMHMEKYKDEMIANRHRELEYRQLTSSLENEIIEYITNRE
jgi:hypothetical protein